MAYYIQHFGLEKCYLSWDDTWIKDKTSAMQCCCYEELPLSVKDKKGRVSIFDREKLIYHIEGKEVAFLVPIPKEKTS